ncbi:Gfo/Idh/MocA family protein [Tundrisphaera lichenicola]|uniref:Gfo/Idh/MocA family protein n=1 Tax=Tundrisphaera lichenicola TaxID=2029860 RepID=UPI003EBD880F
MPAIDRRRFLQHSAALTAGLSAFEAAATRARAEETPAEPRAAEAKKVGPNDQLRVAIIGVRGRGMEHVAGYLKLKDARITTICDADRNVIGPATKAIETFQGSAPKYVQDLRKVFDDPEVDVVSIATPNHWHSLATIWACQAGKDVYVEKPVSHNIFEGRKMVEAARKYNKVVQTGTQCRSHQGIQDAIEFLQSGKLGKLYMAKGLCYKPRGSIGHKPVGPVPEGLDYDLWTGPAELTPFNPNKLHYNWHWVWNTGNGDLGNQGIHQMDLARWGLGKREFPKTVMSSGGRYGYEDDGETPNTLTTAFEFDDALLQFEVRGLATNDEMGVRIGDLFYGSEGVLAITSYTDWQTFMGPKYQKGPGGKGGGDHFNNFLQAVRTRDVRSLNADIEEGHLSSAYCHLGNIAYKLGRKLHINPSTESFVDDAQADALLTRNYRKGFEVPAVV